MIGAPLSALGFGDASVLPSVIGVSAGVLLIGVGLSSLFSARFPYPASRPGDSPFHAPQTSGAGGSTVPTLTFIATVVLALGPGPSYAGGAGVVLALAGFGEGVRRGGRAVFLGVIAVAAVDVALLLLRGARLTGHG